MIISEYLFNKFFSGLEVPYLIEESDTVNVNGIQIYYIAYHFLDRYHKPNHFGINNTYFDGLVKLNNFLTENFGSNSVKKDDIKIVGTHSKPGVVALRVIINGDNVEKLKNYIKSKK